MSYNIDKWKTKKLGGLSIPLEAFYRHERTDWHPKAIINSPTSNVVMLECGCGQRIVGALENGFLLVHEFDMAGEGSGTFYNWILEPALKESKGTLEAVLVWEGGDSINRLTVKDGKVTSAEIDL
jgi:hypothetical protein